MQISSITLASKRGQVFADALRNHQSGQLSEAERLYRRVLEIDPGHADSLHLLGVIAYQLGHYDEAVGLISNAIAINAKVASYHGNLGNALQAQGHLVEAVACYRRALALKPDFAEAQYNLGNALRRQGGLDEAIACYRAALALKPNLAEAENNIGDIEQIQGRLEEAVTSYRKALALKPDYLEAQNNLGIALHAQGRLEEAVACYRKVLALKPDFAEGHNNLGYALHEQGRLEEAVACYRRALTHKPDYADAQHNMGNILKQLGAVSEARNYLEKAIRLSPRNSGYYYSLAQLKQFAAEDQHLAAMKEMAQHIGSLRTKEQIELHFALGKAFADIKQHELSFHHLLQGNALKRKQIAYDEAATLELFQRTRIAFTPEVLCGRQGRGNPSPVPVFIVGMPRSGTSLIEQILASHREIFGAGERTDFEKAVISLSDRACTPFPEVVCSLSDDDLFQLAVTYIDHIKKTAPEATRITDKMPLNFFFIGLIQLALPHARIIHVSRDPVDTCLSCFSMLFAAGQPYSYDLGELGRYYRAYQGLMQHWRDALPDGVMLEVEYEAVIEDLEGQARRLVAHCGLDWDDACLSFYNTKRPVQTASVVQVRQPLYKDAVGRWRPDRLQLQLLLDGLGIPAP